MTNERDIEKRTELRGLAATMLVLVASGAAQIGYLVFLVQKTPRPAARPPIQSTFVSPHRYTASTHAPHMRPLGLATSAKGPR